jgi:hypothetical protein
MSDLFKILRLALYVVALPLAVTAVVSAESLLSVQDGIIDDSGVEVSTASAPLALDVKESHVSHVLYLDAAGGVTGQVMSRGGDAGFYGAPGMNVSLNRNCEAIATATTGNDGVFRFEGVAPGAYTFIATSSGNVTTFGVYVFENAASPAAGEVQFSVAATQSNTSGVRDILNADVQTVAYSYTPTISEISVTNEISQVRTSADGSICGRVVPLLWEGQGQVFDLTGNQVFLLDGNGVVASVNVDADGKYNIPNVAPGIYDFVSFGPHGAAALSIEVLANDTVAGNTTNTSFPASAATDSLQCCDVVLCEPTVCNVVPEETVEVVVDLPQQMGNCCGGGWGGYGGGGGGGGYGGWGDWGGIIGLAFAAWILTEAIDDDDNVVNGGVIIPPVVVPPVIIPPPTSPFAS